MVLMSIYVCTFPKRFRHIQNSDQVNVNGTNYNGNHKHTYTHRHAKKKKKRETPVGHAYLIDLFLIQLHMSNRCQWITASFIHCIHKRIRENLHTLYGGAMLSMLYRFANDQPLMNDSNCVSGSAYCNKMNNEPSMRDRRHNRNEYTWQKTEYIVETCIGWHGGMVTRRFIAQKWPFDFTFSDDCCFAFIITEKYLTQSVSHSIYAANVCGYVFKRGRINTMVKCIEGAIKWSHTKREQLTTTIIIIIKIDDWHFGRKCAHGRHTFGAIHEQHRRKLLFLAIYCCIFNTRARMKSTLNLLMHGKRCGAWTASIRSTWWRICIIIIVIIIIMGHIVIIVVVVVGIIILIMGAKLQGKSNFSSWNRPKVFSPGLFARFNKRACIQLYKASMMMRAQLLSIIHQNPSKSEHMNSIFMHLPCA